METSPTGFNLKNYLDILFVESNAEAGMFCGNSRIWDMLDLTGTLRNLVIRDRGLNDFKESLVENNFGYLYINYNRQLQSQHTTEVQVQNFFFDLVRRLRPQLVIFMTRTVFQNMFQGRERINFDNVPYGVSEQTIQWKLCNRRRGQTFLFVMNRTRNFAGPDYIEALRQLRLMRIQLRRFRQLYPTLPPKNSSEINNAQIQHGNARHNDFHLLGNLFRGLYIDRISMNDMDDFIVQ